MKSWQNWKKNKRKEKSGELPKMEKNEEKRGKIKENWRRKEEKMD